MPTTSMLLPSLSGQNLTVGAFLKQPTAIAARIAELTDKQLIAQHLYHTIGLPVEGGGILWASTQSADQFAAGDLGPRAPGAEYQELQPVLPEPQLSKVEDYGATAVIEEERIKRNDLPYLDQVTTQLSNTLAKKLDRRAFDVLNTEMNRHGDLNAVAGQAWEDTVLDGATPTLPTLRPTADLATVLSALELDELGVVADTLIVHPDEAATLRTVYGADLAGILGSFGLTSLVSNPRATAGTAIVVQAGEAGVIQFEEPLTVRVLPNPENRTVRIQVFAVPAFAPNNARAARRITGIAD